MVYEVQRDLLAQKTSFKRKQQQQQQNTPNKPQAKKSVVATVIWCCLLLYFNYDDIESILLIRTKFQSIMGILK